jgi:hypothetical protein
MLCVLRVLCGPAGLINNTAVAPTVAAATAIVNVTGIAPPLPSPSPHSNTQIHTGSTKPACFLRVLQALLPLLPLLRR